MAGVSSQRGSASRLVLSFEKAVLSYEKAPLPAKSILKERLLENFISTGLFTSFQPKLS